MLRNAASKLMWAQRARTRALSLLALLVTVLIGMLLAANPAHAATTFTVNSTGDSNDTNLGDGLCGVNPLPAPPTTCTLRAALQQANVLADADTINFNIPADKKKVKTIKPSSELPHVEEQVTINGYSQPGASRNTLASGTNAVLKIELNGADAGVESAGLRIRTSDCVVKGLMINRFGFLGGIRIGGPIGDPNPHKDNRIVGNFIGADRSGTIDVGNEGAGVIISNEGSSGNTVGGGRPAGRNLISGNDSIGVWIADNATDNAVLGNLIGTEKDGTSDLHNGDRGVSIDSGASDNIVGGTLPGTANTIAFNHGGVVVSDNDSTGNGILRNSIFLNDGLGIDLGGDAATPNDEDDPDEGPNNLQNYPNLISARNSGGETTIEGKLNSTPNTTFKIRFYSNLPGFLSGDQGKKYIGAKNVTTNANGNTGTFTFKPQNNVPAGQTITATATSNSTGDTSEFSDSEVV